MLPLFLNAASGNLGPSGVPDGTTTTWTLQSGHGARFGTIPSGYFVPMVVVQSATSTAPEIVYEYVYATAISGDVLTVTRQAESASTFPAGALNGGLIVAAVTTPATIGAAATAAINHRTCD